MTRWGGLNTSCSKREVRILSLTFLAILKGSHCYLPIADKSEESHSGPRMAQPMSGTQSRACVTSGPVLCPHSAVGRGTVPGLQQGAQVLHPLTVRGAFPKSTPVFEHTSTTCEMREVLRCFAGQTSYGFLFEQVIRKAACGNFWLLGVTCPSKMNPRTYFALRAPPPPGYLGFALGKGLTDIFSFNVYRKSMMPTLCWEKPVISHTILATTFLGTVATQTVWLWGQRLGRQRPWSEGSEAPGNTRLVSTWTLLPGMKV